MDEAKGERRLVLKSAFYSEQFKDHEVTELGPGEYLWAKPGTGIFSTYIILRQGYIILHGDLGAWVYSFVDGGLGPEEWLRRAAGDLDYMCSKLVGGREKEYDEEMARRRFREQLLGRKWNGSDQVPRRWDGDCKTVDDVDFYCEASAVEGFQEFGLCVEDLNIRSWESAGALWPYHALKTFSDCITRRAGGAKVTATEHELKTWPEHFGPIVSGLKTFECRIDDRGFEVGDTLLLREWDPSSEEYTGRTIRVMVTYVFRRNVLLDDGRIKKYCIMSIVKDDDWKDHGKVL